MQFMRRMSKFREVKLFRKLNHHQNIIKLKEIIKKYDTLNFVLNILNAIYIR